MARLGSGVWLGSIKHCSSCSIGGGGVVQGGEVPEDGALHCLVHHLLPSVCVDLISQRLFSSPT